MKKNKVLSVLAALAIMITPLTGCSGAGSGEKPKNPMIMESSAEQSSVQPSESASEPVSGDMSEPSLQPSAAVSEPSADVSQTSDTVESITPSLWKAEDANGNYVYLMGSIHMGDSSVNYMPDYVMDAYNASDALAVEADITTYLDEPEKALSLMTTMRYDDGTTIKDHISEETYNGAVERLTRSNQYSPMFDSFMPYMWQALLTNTHMDTSGLDAYHGVDYTFLKMAHNSGKNILEIESLQEQFDMFNSFSDELTDLIISQLLDDNYGPVNSESEKQLYEAWKKGIIDKTLIDSLDIDNADETSARLAQEYLDKILFNRNKTMTESIESYIASGQKVFVLVGALHYVGEGGILSLLEKDGYTVTALRRA